jgi:hypothetical protein
MPVENAELPTSIISNHQLTNRRPTRADHAMECMAGQGISRAHDNKRFLKDDHAARMGRGMVSGPAARDRTHCNEQQRCEITDVLNHRI